MHDSLKLTFELSLNVLEKNKRRLYAALSIFTEDEATPEVGIERLWEAMGTVNQEETAELINDLESRALLEVTQKNEPRTIRLHDLLRDLMHAELGETGSNEAHRAILESYRKTRASQGWHTAKDDGYLYDHLVYHLCAVSKIDEIKNLFADQNWLSVRVPQLEYEYDGYLSDLMTAWKTANQEAEEQIEKGLAPDAFIDCMRYALIRSSINSIIGNYVPEVIARELELKVWNLHRALSIAAKVPAAQSKVKLYAVILSNGTLEQSQQDMVQKLGLDAALAIGVEGFRAEALAALAPQLTGEQKQTALQRGLDAALAIRNEGKSLGVLLVFLPLMTHDAGFLKMVYRQMVDYLSTLQNARREDILSFCTARNLFTPSTIFDQNTLNAITNLIIEICWDWHWL